MVAEGFAEYQGIRFGISGKWLPYEKGKTHLKNGDPGYPPEGGYIEDIDIFVGDTSVYGVLSESAIKAITEKAEAMMIGGNI